MKNVRLFAVAAALGMFASTVAAAETTKTTVEWSGDDTVIKVDLGEKLVVAAPTATVTLDKKTTECEGDANGDGLIDGNVYAVNPEINDAQGWLYTNAKYWPTNKNGTAKYYLGLNGARILAPGAEENEGSYVVQLAHKNLEDVDAVFDYLQTEGVVTVNKDEEGNITSMLVGTYTEKDPTTKAAVSLTEAFVVVGTHRKGETEAIDAVVNYFVNGGTLESNGNYYTVTSSKTLYATNDTTPLAYNVEGAGAVVAGDIVLVNYNKRRDEYTLVDVVKAASKKDLVADEETSVATSSDLGYELASLKLGSKTYFLSVDGAEAVEFKAGNLVTLTQESTNAYSKSYEQVFGAELVDAIAYGTEYKSLVSVDAEDLYYLDEEKSTFKKVETLEELTADALDGLTLRLGDLVITDYKLLADAEFDYVIDGAGYTKVSASSRVYSHYTIDGKTVIEAGADVEIFASKSADYNAVSSLGAKDKVTFVEVGTDFVVGDYFNENGTPIDGSVANYLDANRVNSFTVAKTTKGALVTENEFDWENMEFVNSQARDFEDDEFAATALPADFAGHKEGIFFVTSPENDSEYYVLLTNANEEYVGGVNLGTDWQYSTRKEEGYYELEDETLVTKAVELDGAWYPAFETEAELVEFMYAVTGLNTALEGTAKKEETTFGAWYKEAKADLDAGIGELPEGETLPVVATQPIHNAKECEYTVSSTSDKVTVTATNTIDTTVAGVYDLEYAATYEGEVVGTTSIKVVVAPNYTRTWENGRVKTLTSYYVSNPTAKYAEYNYDWAAGTATVTYYTVDGAVADTATITL